MVSFVHDCFHAAIRVTIVEGPPDEDVIIRISDSELIIGSRVETSQH